jgi:DNA helicase-4
LLPKAEVFKHAEERRLFYVALTRAKRHVYLLSDANKASDFVRELIDKDYEIICDEFAGDKFQHSLVNKVTSPYPLRTQPVCQKCGSALQDKGRFRVCGNKACDYVEPVCRQCTGKMILRKGPSGQFWGCANYRKDTVGSCSYTEKSIDLKVVKA